MVILDTTNSTIEHEAALDKTNVRQVVPPKEALGARRTGAPQRGRVPRTLFLSLSLYIYIYIYMYIYNVYVHIYIYIYTVYIYIYMYVYL